MISSSICALACLIAVILCCLYVDRQSKRRCLGHRRFKAESDVTVISSGLRPRKAEWVRSSVLELHELHGLSHRKLAAMFNQLYFAHTGVSVGRTWVRELLIKKAHAALHCQHALKHQVPMRVPNNRQWGIDTTCVTDHEGIQHIVLGAIDHGSRLNLMLRHLRRFNRWTFLGALLLAFGEFGRPDAIKTDNHPVFHSAVVKLLLRWCGVRVRHSRPARPWENGYIERLFGTLKQCLANYPITGLRHLRTALPAFQFWCNVTRPHQHLQGQTQQQAWTGLNPFQVGPRSTRMFSAWGGRLRGMVLRH